MLVLIATGGTARAQATDTDLGPFPQPSAELPRTLEMHETTSACGELADPDVAALYGTKAVCKRIARATVAGTIAEVFEARTALRGVLYDVRWVLVIHAGKKLLASDVIGASYYTKLGADSQVIDGKARLRAVDGVAVLNVVTSNVWNERRETPARAIPWHARAFLACRSTGDGGRCAYATFGDYLDACKTSLEPHGMVHYVCTSVDKTRTSGDVAVLPRAR